MTRNFLLDLKIPEIGEEEVDAHFQLLPDSYFARTPKIEVELHLKMIHKLFYEINHSDSIGTLKPIIDWSFDPQEGVTTVNVVTWDRAGLFHKLAGALNISGYNILSAVAISRTDNIAIDTFKTQHENPRSDTDYKALFEEILCKALASTENLYPKICDTFRSDSTKFLRTSKHSSAGCFHPKAQVYQELSQRCAIIETQSPDMPGLLYRIAQQLHHCGFDITSANIGTKQGVAVDTINFRSVIPNKKIELEALAELKTRITASLYNSDSFAETSH